MSDLVEVTKRELVDLKIESTFAVATAEEAVAANEALGKVKALQDRVTEARANDLAPFRAAIAEINAKYDEPRALLSSAEDTIKQALLEFRRTEQDRSDKARQRELQEAARRRAALLQQAEAARATGDIDVAQAFEATATMELAPQAEPVVTDLAGVSVRHSWRGKVTDLRQFILSISKSPYPLDCISVQQRPLDRLASTLRQNMDKVLPGAIAWEEDSIAKRRVP